MVSAQRMQKPGQVLFLQEASLGRMRTDVAASSSLSGRGKNILCTKNQA
jgi:hypothetical protein